MSAKTSRRGFLQTQRGGRRGRRGRPADPPRSRATRGRAGAPARERPRALRHDRRRHAGLRASSGPRSRFRGSSARPPAISTTAATPWRGDRGPEACSRPAATRSCSTTRPSTASSPPSPTTGTRRSWWTRSAPARTSTARSRCRTPPPTASRWWRRRRRAGASCRSASQRTSSVLCAKAKELIAKGVLGEITLVEGSLGRNDPTGAWQYPPPPDLSPANLDWDTWQGDVPKRRSIPTSSPAGAAGRSTAREWPAT